MPQGSRWFSKFTINLHKRTYGGQKIYQTLNIVFFFVSKYVILSADVGHILIKKYTKYII